MICSISNRTTNNNMFLSTDGDVRCDKDDIVRYDTIRYESPLCAAAAAAATATTAAIVSSNPLIYHTFSVIVIVVLVFVVFIHPIVPLPSLRTPMQIPKNNRNSHPGSKMNER